MNLHQTNSIYVIDLSLCLCVEVLWFTKTNISISTSSHRGAIGAFGPEELLHGSENCCSNYPVFIVSVLQELGMIVVLKKTF